MTRHSRLIPSSAPACLFGVLALLLVSGGMAQAQDPALTEPNTPPVGSAVRWTSKPMRVDPAKQTMPRIQDRRLSADYPELLYVPRSVRTPDSVTFVLSAKTYRMTGIDPVPPQKVCKAREGRRWACGLRSRMALRNMISGKQIRCRVLKEMPEGEQLVDCELEYGVRLSEALLKEGAALAETQLADPVLATAAETARESRNGVWEDPAFFSAHAQP